MKNLLKWMIDIYRIWKVNCKVCAKMIFTIAEIYHMGSTSAHGFKSRGHARQKLKSGHLILVFFTNYMSEPSYYIQSQTWLCILCMENRRMWPHAQTMLIETKGKKITEKQSYSSTIYLFSNIFSEN